MIPAELTSSTEEAHEITIRGRRLRFRPITVRAIGRVLERVGDPLAKVVSAIRSGATVEAALAELLRIAGQQTAIAAEIVLDALREEPWVAGPPDAKAAEELLAAVDGITLGVMLEAVFVANNRSFAALRTEADPPRGLPEAPGSPST